jgi:hypothetical protein
MDLKTWYMDPTTIYPLGVTVNYLGWLSLMSTLEESPIENFGSTKVCVIDPSLFDV